MKLTTLLVACLASFACVPAPEIPVAKRVISPEFNPLDEPGSRDPTASELHAGNIAEITNNPARRLY